MNRIILKLLLAVLPAMLALTACEKDYDGGGPVPYFTSLHIHFVRDDGSPAVKFYRCEGPAVATDDAGSLYRSTDPDLHKCVSGTTEVAVPLFVFIPLNGPQYLVFSSWGDEEHFDPVIRHRFHSRELFGYKEGYDAEMTSYWEMTGEGYPVCTGVTFDGQDLPAADGSVTIVLPE